MRLRSALIESAGVEDHQVRYRQSKGHLRSLELAAQLGRRPRASGRLLGHPAFQQPAHGIRYAERAEIRNWFAVNAAQYRQDAVVRVHAEGRMTADQCEEGRGQ